jgi:hypothetical protein
MRLLLVLALAAGCAKVTPPPVNPSPMDGDAGPASCLDVCRNLQAMGCPAAQPTPEGHTCVEVCATVMESGITSFDLRCRAHATSCQAADRCP